jgi:hypothetical protein
MGNIILSNGPYYPPPSLIGGSELLLAKFDYQGGTPVTTTTTSTTTSTTSTTTTSTTTTSTTTTTTLAPTTTTTTTLAPTTTTTTTLPPADCTFAGGSAVVIPPTTTTTTTLPNVLSFTQISTSENYPTSRSYVWQLAGTPSATFTISMGIYSVYQKWNTTSNNLSSIGSAYAAHLNAQALPAFGVNYQYTWSGYSGSFKPVASWNSANNQLTFTMNWGNGTSVPTMTTPAEAVVRTGASIWGNVP